MLLLSLSNWFSNYSSTPNRKKSVFFSIASFCCKVRFCKEIEMWSYSFYSFFFSCIDLAVKDYQLVPLSSCKHRVAGFVSNVLLKSSTALGSDKYGKTLQFLKLHTAPNWK